MPETPPTAQELKDQIALDNLNGVASFAEGDKRVEMIDLKERLEVANQLAAAEVAASTTAPFGGLRTVALRGGGAWQ